MEKIMLSVECVALGRNGLVRQKGIQIWDKGNGVLQVYPITSRNTDGKAFIELPKEDIDLFINILNKFKNENLFT